MDAREKQLYAVMRLIHRYDYDGAIEIFDLLQQQGTPLYQIVLCCHRCLNFNFIDAYYLLLDQPDLKRTNFISIYRVIEELPFLIKGEPEYIFNELFCNIQIKLDRQDYSDFLGRIFQLRELLLKCAVIQAKEGKMYSLRDSIYEKQEFENHFKLRHGLMNGIKDILRMGSEKEQRILQILTGKAMGDLMDLRHQTIVAHGIETVALKDITRIYGSPQKLMEDLIEALKLLNLNYHPHKYQQINQDIIHLLNQDQPIQSKFHFLLT